VQPDEGVVALGGKKDVDAFVKALGALRLWEREAKLRMQKPETRKGGPRR
jgi:catalase